MKFPVIAQVLAATPDDEARTTTFWDVTKTATYSKEIGLLDPLLFLLAYAAIIGGTVTFIIWRRRRAKVQDS